MNFIVSSFTTSPSGEGAGDEAEFPPVIEVLSIKREQANIINACSREKFYLNIIANNPGSEQDLG
jgi:hypothetical protein